MGGFGCGALLVTELLRQDGGFGLEPGELELEVSHLVVVLVFELVQVVLYLLVRRHITQRRGTDVVWWGGESNNGSPWSMCSVRQGPI